MQYCTACQKAIATIVVMDLTEGSVSGSQHICAECAEQLGAPIAAVEDGLEIGVGEGREACRRRLAAVER